MEKLILEVNESQKLAFIQMAKLLNIPYQTESFSSEKKEDLALLQAMEEGKKEGRATDQELTAFLDQLGK
jgi:hypothetical protein